MRRLGVLAVFAVAVSPVGPAAPAASSEDGSITVSVSGNGRVTSAPGGIDCGSNCAASFPLGAAVLLVAEPAEGSHLEVWRGACTGAADHCVATAEEDVRVDAQFVPGFTAPIPQAFPLRVTRAGNGRVTSTPVGVIDCGTNCSTGFSGGGLVSLVPTPGADSDFEGWTGDCPGTGTCEVALTAARSTTAIFRPRSVPPGSSILTVDNLDPPPPGFVQDGKGTVRVSWPGNNTQPGSTYECEVRQCTYSVPNGTRVTLDALPGGSTELKAWDGGCVGNASPCVVYLGGPLTVVVSFRPTGALTSAVGLNLTRSTGGVVESVPPGIKCGVDTGCRAGFKGGVVVRLAQMPAAGYEFVGWGGACGGAGGCSVEMTVSHWVSAAFRPIRDVVRVVKSGHGSGSVTSEPAAISCGSNCAYSFRRDSVVTLRAVADQGSGFGGWTGACSGSDVCRLTVRAPAEVDARFDLCAAAAFDGFRARGLRSPRRIVVNVELADAAAGRIRLLRSGRALATRRFPLLAVGTNVLRVFVPRRIKRGQAKVELRIEDRCGQVRSRTRTLVLPK